MQIKFKKLHKDAVMPKRGTSFSAGFDLTAVSKENLGDLMFRYRTGIAVEIPTGYVGLVFPRSSVFKAHAILTNSVGVIDSDYRGDIMAVFKEYLPELGYNVGDRIAQLVIVRIPDVEYIEAEELSETERGTCGYGSTGK